MFLPNTAEYALRAMAVLANAPKNAALRSHDLSEQTGIPSHYLSKILRKLVVAGLLSSRKGHGGGFRIARPLQYVRFLDILLAVGYRTDPDRCSFGWGSCDTDNPCPLHGAWSRLNNEFLDWAASTTLKDVLLDVDVAARLGIRVPGAPGSLPREG